MTPITPTEFKALFPEFASVDGNAIQNQINFTVQWLNNGYGSSWRLILFYLTAHLVVIYERQQLGDDQSINPTSSVTVDKETIASDVSPQMAQQFNYLNATSYGQNAHLLMTSYISLNAPFAVI